MSPRSAEGTTSVMSAEGATPMVTSPASSAGNDTPTVVSPTRLAGDYTPTVTSPARSTINPALFRGIELHKLRPATTTSSMARSSMNCQTKGGVLLVLLLVPARLVGTGLSTGSGITSIITVLTSCLSDCRVEAPALQQAPCARENKHVLYMSPCSHEYPPGAQAF